MDDHWLQRLNASVDKAGSLLCAGLDPDVLKMPATFTRSTPAGSGVLSFLKAFVDLSIGDACAYKIQKAFFEKYQEGHELLREVVSYIRRTDPDKLIILDCKIGDIDNTMAAYMEAFFGVLDVDVVVLNPYMGADVLRALRSYPVKGGAVLVRTSNLEAGVVQDLRIEDGFPLWRHVLKMVVDEWWIGRQSFPILSSHVGGQLKGIRALVPEEMPILFPGFGVQGADIGSVAPLLNSTGSGVIVNSSRALLYPYDPRDSGWEKAIVSALSSARERINALR